MATAEFDYETAFSRNIGWFTEAEQASLRSKRIAIAGSGGVGGIHALTLARLGISNFQLADFDSFGVENFNRQVGATMSTVGKEKVDVMETMLRDINPTANINSFEDGINSENIDAFLDGVDLYVDSLDFFAMDARRLVFSKCAERGIPAVTAAPLGMGTAFLCFMPGEMTFEEYFGLAQAQSETELYLRFYLGLAPTAMQSAYLVDASRLDLKAKKGPSTIIGCTLCAGVAASYAVKILLQRGDLIVAPKGMHWDPYLNKTEITSLEGGANNPDFLAALANAKSAFNI
jgi:molybdopterin/thiamine biosynthesis adenylyltransferase